MKRSFIWNLYARSYDVINKNIPYLKMLDNVIRECDLEKNLKILDAGCGTGNLEKKIIQITPDSKITAIDFSDEMLSRAKKKLLHNQNIEFQLVNLEKDLKFTRNYFDRIVSINALYALENPTKIISEFHGLLKPQGKLVFTNPHKRAKMKAIFKKQFKELGLTKFIFKLLFNLPALFIVITINILLLRKSRNYWDQNEISNILETCGFKDIKIKYTYANQNLLVSSVKI